MVQDGHVRVIDVFFVQVRPSPWRQAVDLANMMLVLALRSDSRTVYERALTYFTPEELAEGFAAARGVASPTQLRSMMKQDKRNLVAEFRALAPARRPIAVQRWSFRRVGLIMLTLTIVGLMIAAGIELLFPDRGELLAGYLGGEPPSLIEPECGTNRTMILTAQAVPTAARIPCIDSLPLGWEVVSSTVGRGEATFRLGVEAGEPFIEVTLTPDCPSSEVDPAASVEDVEGGCRTYLASVPAGAEPVPSFESDGGLSYVSREELAAFVEDQYGRRLCGRGVPCP
jgi:hypothetical protein